MRLLSGRAGCCTLDRGAPAGGFGVFRMIPRFFWNVDFQWTDSRRLFGGGFEDMEHEGCGGDLLGGVLLVRRVVARASECVSRARLPGVTRGGIEGGGAQGSAVTARSGRLRVRRGSRARWDRRVGCRGRPGRRRGRFRRPVPASPRCASRMVGRRLVCRDAPRFVSTSLNPRDRTLTREHVT